MTQVDLYAKVLHLSEKYVNYFFLRKLAYLYEKTSDKINFVISNKKIATYDSQKLKIRLVQMRNLPI